MNAAQSLVALQTPHIGDDGHTFPSYDEAPLFRLEPDDAFRQLSARDWAFKDDDTRFLTHDIHPYPAKFIPQIPGTLIASLSGRGELVLDCFGGSGTTALEAIRLGRRAISVDANPLSSVIGRVKTACVEAAGALELHGLQAALAAELQAGPDHAQIMRKYESHAPRIPNRDKWFADTAFAELCLIKGRIDALEDAVAKDIALVALSRIALRASFQDSETRYKSVVRIVPPGETVKRFIREFRTVLDGVADNEATVRYGDARFVCADVRHLEKAGISDGSVDLVVTSPPYGNATDYHLYHRFRLLWLGFDPVALGRVEIGSHLKHQRESSGFESYYADLTKAVETVARVLRHERYAALVLGDSVYKGESHDPAEHLAKDARALGFDACHIIDRPVHETRRSFAHAGRRLARERIVVMRRRTSSHTVVLEAPPYRMWPYERALRLREAASATGAVMPADGAASLSIEARPAQMQHLRSLVFTHRMNIEGSASVPTWQAILENGAAANPGARKDPKYVTHGLHAYKGKFYPQLAKALLNIGDLAEGGRVLDPFCGSGTTMLESHLNGFAAFGCDMNPLAAKIARAKTEILQTDPDVLREAVAVLMDTIDAAPMRFPALLGAFEADCLDEIGRWFAKPVAAKISWLLQQIRKTSAGVVRDFFEVVLSSIIRDVSQQDPTDLRIRYRSDLLDDADVLGLYRAQLALQFERVRKFWKVKGWAPWRFRPAHAIEGDNRDPGVYGRLGLAAGSVDMVLTSPPYGTALPYIDTDRLSLLAIMGFNSADRRPIEGGLTGSREISVGHRKHFEAATAGGTLPKPCLDFVGKMKQRLDKDADAGFRKRNMPALTMRYLLDMQAVFVNLHEVCRKSADVMFVIGDNRMDIGGKALVIPTTDLVARIAAEAGFDEVERIDISVTTENMLHQKNAITENVVLRLRRGD